MKLKQRRGLVLAVPGLLAALALVFHVSGLAQFRAYDKKTGEVVWEMELPGGTTGAPMTYMAGGKQYIVVAVGWKDSPGELIALALPQTPAMIVRARQLTPNKPRVRSPSMAAASNRRTSTRRSKGR